jgi:UDP-N-acetylmuramoyl-tripeptide--D-alanyl-D-alanine ligase
MPIHLPAPGLHNVRNALAAAACAWAAGCSLTQIAAGLANFAGEKSRMQRKRGFNHAQIIDDTYNANPGSVMAAIDFLADCAGTRILVLGDLGELGDIAERVHQDLGHYAAQKRLDAVFTCGKHSPKTQQGAGDIGFAFASKQDLVDALLPKLTGATTVLVKGSRSSRMEEIVNLICPSEAALTC